MLIRALTFVASLAITTGAAATTLTFDEILPDTKIGQTYEAQGYKLSGHAHYATYYNGFYTSSQESALWTGTPGLIFGAVGGGISLTSSTGANFDAVSIDLSRGDSNWGMIPVGFGGKKKDGSWVYATYWFTDTVKDRNETFLLGDAFRNLQSLHWSQGAEWHQFDNIIVSPVEMVPEPSSIALMGLALAGLAFSRRRRP